MRLSHNLAALNIYKEHKQVLKGQSLALGRISSGIKVDSAKDNPNAISQSERLRMQIRGLQMSQRNTQDGISMLQTAQGGLDSISSMLQRVKELTVQAGGVNSDADKKIIQTEIEQIVGGISDAAKNTEFNGKKMIGDTTILPPYNNTDNPKVLNMTIGASEGENIEIPIYNFTGSNLGNEEAGKYLTSIDVTKDGGVDEALSIVSGAMRTVLSASSKYGALESRFEGTYNMSTAISLSDEKADSNLRDADLALEMLEYARNSVLVDAGNAMMVQANKFPQDILRILENVK